MSQPLMVCLGRGQDSYGMCLGMIERGIKPEIVIFADVGSEKRQTYEQARAWDEYLQSHGWDAPVTVRYQCKDFKHWPPYFTLLENCFTNVTLPSLAYGYHNCSSKWKISAINAYIETLQWAKLSWRMGKKILKAIGFDDTPHERMRAERGCQTFAIQDDEKDKYELWFPLQQWGWTRDHAIAAIQRHGLTIPPKSSCFFCPAMKPFEVDELCEMDLKTIIVLEARTAPRHLEFANRKREAVENALENEYDPERRKVLEMKLRRMPPPGKPLIEGLWRREVKGFRGATPKPGSMTEYIRKMRLLPSEEIDRIIAATPTCLFTQEDFQRMGFANWRDWLNKIIFREPVVDVQKTFGFLEVETINERKVIAA